MATASRDPRTIITPDAFSVHPPLLGTPLAGPARRGVALLIDIFLVFLITALTSGVWFVLGVVAAAFFFTRANKARNDRASNVLRFLLGCMGVMALSLTAIVFLGIWYVNEVADEFGPLLSVEEVEDRRPQPEPASSGGSSTPSGQAPDLPSDLAGTEAADVAEVEVPEVAAVAEVEVPEVAEVAAVAQPPDAGLAEAIEVAGDTIRELEQGLARADRDLADTRAELEEALQRPGLVAWLTSRIDSLGFGFGWWTLYFAILMPWMKGQTPGKRAMGVRVVRLDGQPVTWWLAFERAGGYAAGLATGTLGFLQIYWDANRQGIHDKVAGTVVIREGAPKVPGHWERTVTAGAARPAEPGSA